MAHAMMERTNSRKLVERRLASSNYRLLKILGEGTYGTVYLARDGVNKQLVAIKVIEKRRISPDDMVRVRREIQVLSVLRQPNIIQIFRVHEDDTSLYLVMEFADGGELYDFVERRKKLSSTEARAVFRQIVAAVHYCHKNGVVHRDLKLENILLNSKFQVKLTDFGLCNYFSPTGRLSTFCGSPLYASPEIISGQPYMGPEIDCWSLGVLLYSLVYGSMPFGHAEFAKLRAQILSGQFFAPPDAGEFSDAHDLICSCLNIAASQRATIDQISMHWWTNMGYAHYPHCDIYCGVGAATEGDLPSLLQPTCSCFFDVLSQQLSSPPDQFRGKLATTKKPTTKGAAHNHSSHNHHNHSHNDNTGHNNNNNNNKDGSEFMGVHAQQAAGNGHRSHRSHSHSHHSRQKVPSGVPTQNSPPSPRQLAGGAGVIKAVSADSLNGCGDYPEETMSQKPWKFFQQSNASAVIPPLNVVDSSVTSSSIAEKVPPLPLLPLPLGQPAQTLIQSLSTIRPSPLPRRRCSSAPGYLQTKPARQVSSTSFDLPLLTQRRSASLGRRMRRQPPSTFELMIDDIANGLRPPPGGQQNLLLFEEEEAAITKKDKLLSSLLDQSVEHLDEDPDPDDDDNTNTDAILHQVLHRQLSNYDNLSASVSPRLIDTFEDPPPPPRIDTLFNNSDDILLGSHAVPALAVGSGAFNVLSSSSSASSSSASSPASSTSRHSHSSRSCSLSHSCSSSSSCSCGDGSSSIYDGFVGQAAILQHQQNQEIIPPLEFLTPKNNDKTGSGDSSSSGDLYVDESSRSAPAALAIVGNITNNNNNNNISKPSTLVDSISSLSSSKNDEPMRELRVLDDDDDLDNESRSPASSPPTSSDD